MNMKKRLLAMLMAGAMALSLTACGGTDSQPASDTQEQTGDSAQGETPVISVILRTALRAKARMMNRLI